jgi:putative ABC transport system ATP-binding protein
VGEGGAGLRLTQFERRPLSRPAFFINAGFPGSGGVAGGRLPARASHVYPAVEPELPQPCRDVGRLQRRELALHEPRALVFGARRPLKVELQDVRHVYRSHSGPRDALRIAELQIESGAHTCLVGRSGSGKTTLLNVLCGVLAPTSGRVVLGGTDLFALSEPARDALRSRSIGCVFQTFNLLGGLSALENLTLAQRFAGISAQQARRRADELLELLGLRDRAGALPSELSVGEQQRVAIARAVSKSPGLVLADEPTASLDDDNAALAIELLFETCARSTLVVVTHDPRLIRRFPAAIDMAALSVSS